MTNYENDIQVITKNGAEGELTQSSINNGEIESVNTTTLQSEANELNPLAEPVATGQKNIISVDEASSIASGNNVYINQDNKLMQIDYDTLATAILNKLSTQSFNSLNTSSKLVLDAINELNGKSFKYTRHERITYSITTANEYVKATSITVEKGYFILCIFSFFDYGKPYAIKAQLGDGNVIGEIEYPNMGSGYNDPSLIIPLSISSVSNNVDVYIKRTSGGEGQRSIDYILLCLR